MVRLSEIFHAAGDEELIAAYEEFREHDPIKGGKTPHIEQLCAKYSVEFSYDKLVQMRYVYSIICEELAYRYHYLLTEWKTK